MPTNSSHALGDRLQVVFRAGIVRHFSKRLVPVVLRPAPVVARKIGFVDERSMTDHNHPMRIGALQSGKTRTESANTFPIEPFLGGVAIFQHCRGQ
jgi:hypothetical protein